MSLTNCAVIDGKFVFGWNNRQIELSGQQLRRRCRCAECRSQSLAGAVVAAESEPADHMDILAASPMGYGVQLHFSDGHNRGVFPWSYLVEIADAEAST